MDFASTEGFEYALVYWDRSGGYSYRGVELADEKTYRMKAEELARSKGAVHVCRLVNVVDPTPTWRL